MDKQLEWEAEYFSDAYEAKGIAKNAYIAGATSSSTVKNLEKRISDADFEIGNALAVISSYDWERGDPGSVIMSVERYILKAKKLLAL